MRPLRKYVSEKNLLRMGVPKEFINKELSDFDTYGLKQLELIKDFVNSYITNIENYLDANRGILFFGSNGVGKSMLSSLILKEAYRHRYICKRITFSSYINEYTRMWNAKPQERDTLEGDFYYYIKGVDLLVLEEVGKELDTKLSVTVLEDLLRYREERGLTTILCTNLKPKELFSQYGASVQSLLQGMCLPVKMVGDDQRKVRFNNNAE